HQDDGRVHAGGSGQLVIGNLTRHPWNTDFEWSMPSGPYRALTEEQATHFNEDGFVVLEDVLPLDLVAQVRHELDGFEANTEEWLKEHKNSRVAISEAGAITFTTHLVARSEIARRFATHPPVLDLCADLIRP